MTPSEEECFALMVEEEVTNYLLGLQVRHNLIQGMVDIIDHMEDGSEFCSDELKAIKTKYLAAKNELLEQPMRMVGV